MMIKRFAKIVLLVIGAVAVALGVLLAVTFLGRKPIANGADIGGIRIVQDGVVAVGLVPLGVREVALVDAGNDPAGHPILEELARRQLGPDAVTTILVTHGHPDHIAAIRVFPYARVVALEAEAPLIEGRTVSLGPLPKWVSPTPTGITVHRLLLDGEQLQLVPRAGDAAAIDVHVFAVPGHTPGSAAYLINGVLFIGDSADIGSGGTLLGAPWIFSESQPDNRRSLVMLSRRLSEARIPVTALVPSHSGDADGLDALTTYAEQHATGR